MSSTGISAAIIGSVVIVGIAIFLIAYRYNRGKRWKATYADVERTSWTSGDPGLPQARPPTRGLSFKCQGTSRSDRQAQGKSSHSHTYGSFSYVPLTLQQQRSKVPTIQPKPKYRWRPLVNMELPAPPEPIYESVPGSLASKYRSSVHLPREVPRRPLRPDIPLYDEDGRRRQYHPYRCQILGSPQLGYHNPMDERHPGGNLF